MKCFWVALFELDLLNRIELYSLFGNETKQLLKLVNTAMDWNSSSYDRYLLNFLSTAHIELNGCATHTHSHRHRDT